MDEKDEKKLLTLVAYVMTSSYRTRALTVLYEEKYMIPSHLAKACNVRSNHISKTLKELTQHGLVFCINPEVRKGRVYRISGVGEEVYKALPLLKEKTLGELNDL